MILHAQSTVLWAWGIQIEQDNKAMYKSGSLPSSFHFLLKNFIIFLSELMQHSLQYIQHDRFLNSVAPVLLPKGNLLYLEIN